ncbi:MAG: xanthine dehydrogenase family protein subunit M [Flexilinea sp.]
MDVLSASSLEEAVRYLQMKNAAIVAGGTDILVKRARNKLIADTLIDICGLSTLRGISCEENCIRIGALTTFAILERELEAYPFCAALREAAHEMGAPQIRNRATIGGNIVTGSPAGDGIVALLALDAKAELVSNSGKRCIALHDFFTCPGKTVIRPDEILTALIFPQQSGNSCFYKVGKRNALAIAVLSEAVYAEIRDDKFETIRITVGSAAPIPMRAFRTENFLLNHGLDEAAVNEAVRLIRDEISPIDDVRATVAYRRELAGNILRVLLNKLTKLEA